MWKHPKETESDLKVDLINLRYIVDLRATIHAHKEIQLISQLRQSNGLLKNSQYRGRQEKIEIHKEQLEQTKNNSKIVDLNTNVLITTVHVNGLNQESLPTARE